VSYEEKANTDDISTDLTETCKINLDHIDATLSELWQNLGEAKQTMQTSQLKFQEGVSELLRRYGRSREAGVKMIQDYLSGMCTAGRKD
jgi:DNA-binding transcriptional regulator WhiA